MGCINDNRTNYSDHDIQEESKLRKFEEEIGAYTRCLNNILPRVCIEKEVIPIANVENIIMNDFTPAFVNFLQQGFFFKEVNGVKYYDARKIDLLLFLLTNDSEITNSKVSYQCKASFVFTMVKTRDDQNLNEPLEENEENFVKFVEDVVEIACVGIPDSYIKLKNITNEGMLPKLKEVRADIVKRIITDLFFTKDKHASVSLSFQELNDKFESDHYLLTAGFVREYGWRILQDGKGNQMEKEKLEKETKETKETNQKTSN